jgi:LEA14-like dessication related protein
MRIRRGHVFGLVSILLIATLYGCAVVGGLFGRAGIKQPTAEFTSVELADVGFDRANLLFNITVANPNGVGLRLARFDYDFAINGSTLVKGDQSQETELAAHAESVIKLPVTIEFDDVYRIYASLKDADTAGYGLACGLSFRIPVLGNVRIPIRREGTFPLIKRPTVRVDALRIKRMTLTGAELGLMLRVTNPNAFSAVVDSVHCAFKVDGKTWATGAQTEPAAIREKGEGQIEIGVRLNFLQIGVAVSRSLLDRKPLQYDLDGGFELKTSLPMFERANLPFHLNGEIKPTE